MDADSGRFAGGTGVEADFFGGEAGLIAVCASDAPRALPTPILVTAVVVGDFFAAGRFAADVDTQAGDLPARTAGFIGAAFLTAVFFDATLRACDLAAADFTLARFAAGRFAGDFFATFLAEGFLTAAFDFAFFIAFDAAFFTVAFLTAFFAPGLLADVRVTAALFDGFRALAATVFFVGFLVALLVAFLVAFVAAVLRVAAFFIAVPRRIHGQRRARADAVSSVPRSTFT